MNGAHPTNPGPDPAPPRPAAMPAPQPAWPAPQPQPQMFDARKKSPGIAAVLSLCPGLGQIYVGYYTRGFAHAIVVGSLIAMLNTGEALEFEPLLGFFLAFFWLYNVIDAGRRAALYNHVMEGMAAIELPQDFEMPRTAGSIAGGAVLIVAGAVALSHTAFGMSLEWLRYWWPAAPLAVGLYLVLAGIRDRAARTARAAERD